MMKKWMFAMIIVLAPVCLTGRVALAAEPVKLPDPASFSQGIETGDLDKARAWLEAGLEPDFMGARIGSGLMIGAWEGNIPMMRLFIANGADINRLNANGESALMLAAWKGHQEAIKWLLERGARINSGPNQWSALHYAVFAGKKESANYLIAEGADVNARSTNGSSVLMMAIYEGHEDMVQTLLEKGADRSVRNDWGDGALEWAMRHNRLKIARMITRPEEFNIAISEPREKWGEAQRSLGMSAELEKLLRIREAIMARNLPTKSIDDRIAAERARIVEAESGRQGLPPRAAVLEITASRKNPTQQSARMIKETDDQPKRFKVPPVTYTGQPKMPVKGTVKNY